MANQINIVYFAWVKERLGRDQEAVDLPEVIENVGQLIEHLQNHGPAYRDVFPISKSSVLPWIRIL